MDSAFILPLFSTPIYCCEDVGYRLTDKEKDCVNSMIQSPYEKDENYLSNNVHVLDNLVLSDIRELCQKYLNHYTKEALKIKQDFYITNSWITAKNKGQYHHAHDHQNCIFSGVFYANANENMGDLIFNGNPGYLQKYGFSYNYGEQNVYNSTSWRVPVKTGTLIIFPSHVRHGVDENCDDGTRIVIGFNSFVRGDFGMEKNDSYCSQLRL